jgi:hypothetical protein
VPGILIPLFKTIKYCSYLIFYKIGDGMVNDIGIAIVQLNRLQRIAIMKLFLEKDTAKKLKVSLAL